MGSNAPPIRGAIENHDQAADGGRSPIEPCEDELGAQPLFDVEAANGVVDGGQLGLDLDDEGDPACRTERKDVDRAALAEFRERNLQVGIPPAVGECVRRPADQRGVLLVEQPIDLPATPRNESLEAGIDRGERSPERVDR